MTTSWFTSSLASPASQSGLRPIVRLAAACRRASRSSTRVRLRQGEVGLTHKPKRPHSHPLFGSAGASLHVEDRPINWQPASFMCQSRCHSTSALLLPSKGGLHQRAVARLAEPVNLSDTFLSKELGRFLRFLGLVDPDGAGQLRWFGWLTDARFWAGEVGGSGTRPRASQMAWARRLWTSAGVCRPIPECRCSWACPAEEPVAESAGVLGGPESVGEVRPVIQGLELRLGVGVVIRSAAGCGSWSRPGRRAAASPAP